jgi:phosphocarrier protein FPr/phosphocarrier protein
MVAIGDPLLRVALGPVADAAKSLITPIVLVEALGHTLRTTAAIGLVRQGDPVAIVEAIAADAPASSQAPVGPTLHRSLRVPLADGLHARPAGRLAQAARGFTADLRLTAPGGVASLASPSAILRLGVRHGDTITVLASGTDAGPALDAIATMIADGMGEFRALPAADNPAQSPKPRGAPPAVLTGVTAAPGLAIGVAWRPQRAEPAIAGTSLGADREQARFDAAFATLKALLAAEAGRAGGVEQAIVAAHLAFLDDPELIAATRARIAAGASAGGAWRAVLHAEAQALRALPDPRFAERANDLVDLELRLQWQLVGGGPPPVVAPEAAILIADDLLPSDVAALDPARVVALATARGGPTSHVAIIAASRGLPALVALGGAVLDIAEGTALVLDATAARLECDPCAARLDQAREDQARRFARRAAARASAQHEGRTRNGVRIEVCANLGRRADALPTVAAGAEGCGLLRSEFLFLDRAAAPDEDEQAGEYARIAQDLGGRPLIVRLLDIGGDKPAPYLPIGPEENPALGLRGIRVGLARHDILLPQVRAILRAAQGAPVSIMVPMIARLDELAAVKAIVAQQAAELGLALPPLGVMVETPAAAVMADALAHACDFLSIGTNDLTQYTLAMDRGNPAVAGSIDGLDPAVLRLIAQTCSGGRAHGKWVGVCGSLASEPLAVPLLVGLGVTELSVAPAMIAETKAVVRVLDTDQCAALAEAALGAASAAQVRQLAHDFARENAL